MKYDAKTQEVLDNIAEMIEDLSAKFVGEVNSSTIRNVAKAYIQEIAPMFDWEIETDGTVLVFTPYQNGKKVIILEDGTTVPGE